MIFNADYADTVTIEVEREYDAGLFWANLEQEFPWCADALRKRGGRAVIKRHEWDAIQLIEGFSGGPVYAPTALIRISLQ